MIAKLLFMITITNLWLGTSIELPRDDLVILETGEQIEGQIDWINDGMINIKTDSGEKLLSREGDIYSFRDIVETGIVKNKRHSGHVVYLGFNYLEMKTSSGKFTVKRPLIRKIILSQDSMLPPLDL